MDSFMNWWQALVLGILQGFTEYLPVSSSGHLAVAELILGLRMPTSLDVLLHLATLIPTIWIFRQKIAALLHSFFCIMGNALRPRRKTLTDLGEQVTGDARYIVLVLLVLSFTSIVAYPQRAWDLKFQPRLIASAFLFTALLLLLQHFWLKRRSVESAASDIFPVASWKKNIWLAVCLGSAQGIAALPGVSRSGMTISVALLLGLKRREAGEFSFIISIPVIIGALLLDAQELLAAVNGSISTVLLAFVAACLSGFVALRLLLALLNKGNFYVFSIYLFLLSGFTFWYFL